MGGQETHSLTACLCLASVPSLALPRSLSHWEMSRVSHHHQNTLPSLQEVKEGESRARWAFGHRVCPHTPALVSMEWPMGQLG